MTIQGMANHQGRWVTTCPKAVLVLWFKCWLIYATNINLLFLQPTEQNTYADIEAAYKCLEENYGAKQENIILYGQSVGSGPTVDLAARLPRLRASILHSPILSGLRVMYPVKRTYWFDIYKVNIIPFWFLYIMLLINILPHWQRFVWSSPEHWQNYAGEVSCPRDSCKFPWSKIIDWKNWVNQVIGSTFCLARSILSCIYLCQIILSIVLIRVKAILFAGNSGWCCWLLTWEAALGTLPREIWTAMAQRWKPLWSWTLSRIHWTSQEVCVRCGEIRIEKKQFFLKKKHGRVWTTS